MARNAFVFALVMLPALALGAPEVDCVGDTPVAVTRWVVQHRPWLSAVDSERFVSAQFLDRIHADETRSAASGATCALCDGDLWNGAQEGYAHQPAAFTETTRSDTEAVVTYPVRDAKAGPRHARVVLVKEGACWKIDDLITPAGSMKQLVSN